MKKRKLNHKIFFYLSLVIVLIFTLMWVSFNVVTSRYIKGKAKSELAAASKVVNNLINKNNLKDLVKIPAELRVELRAISKVSNFIGSTDFMVVSLKNNNIVYPKNNNNLEDSSSISLDLLTKLNEKYPILQLDYLYKISLNDSEYYLSVYKPRLNGNAIIFYTDISLFKHFVRTLNLLLILIFVIGGILALTLSLWVSGRITRPINELSDFAQKVGSGTFKTNDFDYDDIEFNELSKNLNNMTLQLKEYDLEQKLFFQNISHDLRTPLMSIQGYAEGLVHDVFKEPKEIAGIMVEECERLTSMVNDILFLSKWNSGNVKLNKQPVNLVEVLESSIISSNGLAIKESKEITFSSNLEEVCINADIQSLHRAFVNLLSNCIRHANKMVNVCLDVQTDKIMIIFKDDGVGFTPEDLQNLFNRHYKGKKGEFGIGLSIVKTIFDFHKASIVPRNNNGGEFLVEMTLM